MDVSKLVGIDVAKLSPRDLSALQSSISKLSLDLAARQKEIKEAATTGAFAVIAGVAKEQIDILGWQKLPSLTLTGQDDGTYKVTYATAKVKKTEPRKGNGDDRQTLGPHAGKITVGKMGEVLGGIAKFKLPDGREFETLRETVVTGLGYDPEDRSYSLSRRLTDKHPEVTLVLTNKQEITVGDAIEKMKEARAQVAKV